MVKRIGTFDVTLYVFLLLVAFTMLYPFWELFVLSFMEHQEARRYGFKIWPKKFILDNYIHVLENDVIFLAYRNTVIRTVLGVTVSIILTFMTAYPLAHKTLPLNKPLTMLLTFTMFFSGGLIPTYLLMRSLGMYNNLVALVFVNLLSPFYIFLLRNYIRGVPDSLEESAKMDGASYLTILSRIIIPVCKPIVATLGLWIAVLHWNAWFDAMIYTPKPALLTLQMYLRNILLQHQVSAVDELLLDFQEPVLLESIIAVNIILTIGPIVLVYPWVQKYFIRGVFAGSIKG